MTIRSSTRRVLSPHASSVVTYRALHTRIALRVVAASLTTYFMMTSHPHAQTTTARLHESPLPFDRALVQKSTAIAVSKPVYPECFAVDLDNACNPMMYELTVALAVRHLCANCKSWMTPWPEKNG